MNKQQLLLRSIRRCAEPARIFGISLISTYVQQIDQITIGKRAVESSYRVRVVFNTTGVSDAQAENKIAYFLADLSHCSDRFRLKVISICVDQINGTIHENLKGY